MSKNQNDLELLRAAAEKVTLNVGDIIFDHMANIKGTLVNRIHHIDMIKDDVYLWEVKLFKIISLIRKRLIQLWKKKV